MIFIFLAGFVPLTARLAKLQIVDYEMYQQKAIEQQTRDTVIKPKRGTIYDRNGKVLAESASAETVFISPVNIKDETEANLLADGLSEILGIDRDKILKKTENKKSYYEELKKRIEKPEADKVREFINNNSLKSVHLAEDSKRYYPYGNFASHILGFVGDENTGLDGIEAVYDAELRGVSGRVISAKNASGSDMPFKYEKYVDAQNGLNVVLTIDEVIQHFLEKQLEAAVIEHDVKEGATGIVMDVTNGEILALAMKNDYDPNDPFTITDEKMLAEIAALPADQQTEAKQQAWYKMWRNKAISDTYEPGSVFKTITASMALEENVVSQNDHFNCPGYMVVANRRISCWKTAGHGSETFVQGVQNSCNPVFMTVSAKVGRDTFYKYFSAFGLTEKTGIDLPGEASNAGLYHKLDALNPVELAVSSFGQTFKVTPLQMLTAISAVANGGTLYTPHVVKSLVDDEGVTKKSIDPIAKRQVISEETSKEVCAILETVVSEGTGKNAYVRGYRVAGKTGTSEKIDKKNEQGEVDKKIVSFMGFAPADNPKIAVLVLLDEPGHKDASGGSAVAPLVGKILEESLKYLKVEPVYTDGEMVTKDVTTPDLINESVASAAERLKNLGLADSLHGNGDTVTDQIPKPGAKLPEGGTVILYSGDAKPESKAEVPDVVGLTPDQATKKITSAGLYINMTGTKKKSGLKATKQSPAAGTVLDIGAVVTVEFIDKSENIE